MVATYFPSDSVYSNILRTFIRVNICHTIIIKKITPIFSE